MTNHLSDLDFTVMPEAVALTESQVGQALQWSQVASSEEQQWQLYLQGLALLVFEQWLPDRDASLSVERVRGSVPSEIPFLPAVMLQVNEFRLCLLVTGSLSDTQVAIPRAVVDLPLFTPHLYVLIEMQEELDQARVTACLRYDQLVQQRATLQLQRDWSYAVPRGWFESSPDDLLLWLSCLEPEAIPWPVTSTNAIPAVNLEPLLPQIKTCEHLWQVLSWEQVAAVLEDAEQTAWLQRALQSRDFVIQSGVLENLALNSINTALWLQQTVEDWARSWVLVPSLALRSTDLAGGGETEGIASLIGELQRQGIEIPAAAAGAYRDLSLGSEQLRLYTVVWSADVDWTLLLILGSQPDTVLGDAVRLQICDANQVLVDQMLRPESQETYVYSIVGGALDEQFWAMLMLEAQDPPMTLQLAPFRFEPPVR